MRVLTILIVAILASEFAAQTQNDGEGCGLPGSEGCGMEAGDAAQIALLVKAREMPESDTPVAAPFAVPVEATRRNLTAEERATFDRDGYVVLKGFFSPDEVAALLACMESDPLVQGSPDDGSLGKNISVPDADGRDTKLTLWWYFGDDSWGQAGRGASMVKIASELMNGAEPFHSHTKIILKEPRKGGAWEWHQDFGYWYAQGLNHPDGIVSAIVALDPNTRANGALKLLRRSHKLGRLDHGVYGGQAGADPGRVLAAMKLPNYDVRPLLLEPGDVCFTHSNLLHASSPNLSETWRRNVVMVYNSKKNAPLPIDPPVQPAYNPIDVVPDGALLARGCVPLSDSNDFMGQAAADGAVDNSENQPVVLDDDGGVGTEFTSHHEEL